MVIYLATRTRDTDSSSYEESTEGGKFLVNYHSVQTLKNMPGKTGFDLIETNVEPDDAGRPFDYVYILAGIH